VLAYLHEQSPAVQQIKACNCIRIADGKLIGYNTDVLGFQRSLEQQLQPHHTHALILGTGGAAKAVAFALEQLQLSYQFVSRKPGHNTIGYQDLLPGVMASHTLIINTTPLGTYPNITEAPPIPYDLLTSRHHLYDLVYNPEETLFLQKGKQQGAQIQNGADMLVIQAEESWKIWNS
jgi:shikimate dehydrogenase